MLTAEDNDDFEDWLNSFDYEDDEIIQFGILPSMMTPDIVFMLPMSFMALPDQPITMNGDVIDPGSESTMISQLTESGIKVETPNVIILAGKSKETD